MVASIGFFDGVHRGHQCLIQQVRDEALRRGMRSLLITFDRHPRSVFAPAAVPPQLTTAEEKMELLKATGVDEIYVLPFDKEMAALTAKEFMQQVLKEQLGVKVLVIGYDHRFGRPAPALKSQGTLPIEKSQGTLQAANAIEGFPEYQAYGREMGIEVVLAQELEGEHVSSSEIRRALAAGDVQRAAQLLGRPYTWTGCVVHGHEVGRQLGFPTANLVAVDRSAPLGAKRCSAPGKGDTSHLKNGQWTTGKILPANGAYAVKVRSEKSGAKNEEWTTGMLNIGQRPTLDNGTDTSIEAHLFDFHGDLYGQVLTLSFIARLREERRFNSEAELTEQLKRDKEMCLALV